MAEFELVQAGITAQDVRAIVNAAGALAAFERAAVR